MPTLLERDKTLRPFEPGEYTVNSDGTFSTERTVTFPLEDGAWVNVPSLWMGPAGPVDFGQDEDAIRDAMLWFEKRTGKRFPRFVGREDAEAEAAARSERGGAFQGTIVR